MRSFSPLLISKIFQSSSDDTAAPLIRTREKTGGVGSATASVVRMMLVDVTSTSRRRGRGRRGRGDGELDCFDDPFDDFIAVGRVAG